jgi:hypothetical protein
MNLNCCDKNIEGSKVKLPKAMKAYGGVDL